MSDKLNLVCSACGKKATKPKGGAFGKYDIYENVPCVFCGGMLVISGDSGTELAPMRIKRPNGSGLRSLKDCLVEAGAVMEQMLDDDGMPFEISKNEIAAQLIIEESMPLDTDEESPTFGQRIIGNQRLLELWITTTAPKDDSGGKNELESALGAILSKIEGRKAVQEATGPDSGKPGDVTFEAE